MASSTGVPAHVASQGFATATETQFSPGDRAYFNWRDSVPDYRRGLPEARYGFLAGFAEASARGDAVFWRDDALGKSAEIVRYWFGADGEECAKDIEALLSSEAPAPQSEAKPSACTPATDEQINPPPNLEGK